MLLYRNFRVCKHSTNNFLSLDDCTLMLEHGSALTHTVQTISGNFKPNTSVTITLKGALIVGTPILRILPEGDLLDDARDKYGLK